MSRRKVSRRKDDGSQRVLSAFGLAVGLVSSFRLDERQAALGIIRDAKSVGQLENLAAAAASLTAACLDAWSHTEPEAAAAFWTDLAAEVATGPPGWATDVG